MDFRDVQAFNYAMLAKQAWQLIHNTHSLFYRIYKSRYFPNCSFMNADWATTLPMWRSLLAPRDIVREGTQRKVGDGSNIEVSTHC